MRAAPFSKEQYETARRDGCYLAHITLRDPGKGRPGSAVTVSGPVDDETSRQIKNAIKELLGAGV